MANPPKHCWECGKENTYELYIKDEILELSEGRKLLMQNSKSFKCSICGDEIYSGEQSSETENFITLHYPDYYKK